MGKSCTNLSNCSRLDYLCWIHLTICVEYIYYPVTCFNSLTYGCMTSFRRKNIPSELTNVAVDLLSETYNCYLMHVAIVLDFSDWWISIVISRHVDKLYTCNPFATCDTVASFSKAVLRHFQWCRFIFISIDVWGLYYQLTHWGRVTHICVSKSTIIGSDNGVSPGQRQAIVWTNAGILLIRTEGKYFSEILSENRIFSFKKMDLKMSSAKLRPFCIGVNVLIYLRSR